MGFLLSKTVNTDRLWWYGKRTKAENLLLTSGVSIYKDHVSEWNLQFQVSESTETKWD